MGIVVTVFMALAIMMAWPWSTALAAWRLRHTGLVRATASGILLAGLWNALWHGIRHPDQFWGQAALVSGLVMVVAATLLLRGRRLDHLSPDAQGRVGVSLLVVALLACFLLYAITLVRLNLGLSIPGA